MYFGCVCVCAYVLLSKVRDTYQARDRGQPERERERDDRQRGISVCCACLWLGLSVCTVGLAWRLRANEHSIPPFLEGGEAAIHEMDGWMGRGWGGW